MMPEYVVSPHKILATHAFFGTLHVRNVEFAVGLDAKKKKTRGFRCQPFYKHTLMHCKKKSAAEPASNNLTTLY